MTRVPVGSCDFSTRPYSLCDTVGDFNMTTFKLVDEDTKLKVPLLQQALALAKGTGTELKLFANAWSSPGWMKNTGRMKGGGFLLGSTNGPYYMAFATYYRRFFEEYSKLGVNFWGMTPENEPTEAANPDYGWQALFFNGSLERDFIKYSLGPQLKSSDVTKNLKIMIGDDQRYVYPAFADVILSDPESAKYVDGIAVHWYDDNNTGPGVLDTLNSRYPSKWIMYTEACSWWKASNGDVVLGAWWGVDQYAHNIIEDLNHWATGWNDWNLILDIEGGPNWVGNFVDAPMTSLPTTDEFIKNPMFYGLGHFSKFLRPGYIRVHIALPSSLEGTAFISSDGSQKVAVILNRNIKNGVDFSLQDTTNSAGYANIHIGPASIITVIW
ncbi:unnamed protein product, partial [Mesorhabditis belari]|uniref:Glucosylceramidase n=1 Tax=Mesorhabditis belari TaxID=2138241 RepID=A0AAF3J734_9BILA